MKINCTIDGLDYSLNVNSQTSLKNILAENIKSFACTNSCRGGKCGNCIVMLNGVCVLACTVAGFTLDKANIMTFDGFKHSRMYQDIEKAYETTNMRPCIQCFASKTLLIESIIEQLQESTSTNIIVERRVKKKNTKEIDSEYIERELSINNCRCMEFSQIEKIIDLAYMYRKKRSGRNY